MSKPAISHGMMNVLEKINTGIIVLDRDGGFSYSNDAAVSILGFNLSDLIYKRFLDLFSDEKMRTSVQSVQSGISEQTVFEMKIGERVVKIAIRAFNEDSTGPGSILLIIEDISRFRELEKIKAEFIETLLHRLRTPLTTVKSGLSFLSKGNLQDSVEDVREIFEMCLAETNRLVFFLNDLKDLFLIESDLIQQTIDRRLTPLAPLLKKAINAIALECREKEIEIGYDEQANLAVIEGDEERLFQAITNILVNAVTFCNRKGRITINVTDEDENVRLSITDTGIGMAESELQHAFEKYYRADNQITRNVIGYGLGLYIAKYLIELSGGRIYAYSEAGKGSQFDLIFPR